MTHWLRVLTIFEENERLILKPSFGLPGLQVHIWFKDIHGRQNTSYTFLKKFYKRKNSPLLELACFPFLARYIRSLQLGLLPGLTQTVRLI